MCYSGKTSLNCGQTAELLPFKRGNCDGALFVCSRLPAGALKSALAVGGYPAPCLQEGAVRLTAGEVVSKVYVLTVWPIVLCMLAHDGKSLRPLSLVRGWDHNGGICYLTLKVCKHWW